MNIYITLDYELFLGRVTGTPENCLFRPMDALMQALEKTDTKLTIFADGAYLVRMSELKEKHSQLQIDYQNVLDNIKEISERGHSVQYHFHPQWLYSDFDEKNGWIMDLDHYKLSDVPKEKLSASFKKGVDIIESATGKKMQAFRAGGFSLCSYEWYGPLFKENGIILDSSVKPGEKENSKYQIYDYRSAPSSKSPYRFNKDVCKETKDDDAFFEMPISSSKGVLWLYYFFFLRKKYKRLYKPSMKFGDGYSVNTQASKAGKLWDVFKKLFGRYAYTATIDPTFNIEILSCVYEDYKRKGMENLVLIGHPKSATDISIKNLEQFIDNMEHKGNEFCTLENVLP